MPSPIKPFNIDSFLAAVHARRKIIHFRTNQTIFSQGEDSDAIFYIEKGSVKLTITSEEGREAIVGVFGGGDFFGESCIASDLPVRFHTAIAITDTRVVNIGRDAIINALRASSDALYAFVSSLLRRDARMQQDLASYILETGEKRLARALLMIARLNENHTPPFAKFSQQDWADMIGLTRQRVNVLLQGFRKSGFISDARGFKVNPVILTVLQKGLGRKL
jgi:CRP/FNR family transcriptional regulator, cyclic AMP receptor protein